MRTDLEIAAVRAVLLSYRYPAGEELSWVGGTIRSWDAALVEVTLSDGTTGVGEAGAGIMAAVAVPGIIQALQPYLVGVALGSPLEVGDHLRAYTAFWSRGGILSGVIGALEIAAVDAVTKREGVPAYELLGGPKRVTIEAYASGGLGTSFDQVTDWAAKQVAAGFRTVKFRAMLDPTITVQLIEHVADTLAPGIQFVVDAVQACAASPWTVDEAIRVGRCAEALGARWFEEPCQANDIDGYARVRRALKVPISGVESNGTEREFDELFRAGAIDIAQPDVTFVGGPRAFSRVAARAASAGLSSVPHVWGSGVAFAANLHTAFADPHVELFEYCALPNPLRDAMQVQPPELVAGQVQLPKEPGLGVRLTEEIEREYAFSQGGGHVIR